MTGRRRLGRIALAAAGAALLGLLVVRISAADALFEADPAWALGLAPNHPETRLHLAHDQLRVAGAVAPETELAALEAFERAPLSEVPLLVAARRALDAGDGEAADRLLAAALRRNPRSRYGLLLQLDRDVRDGRSAEAAGRMVALARLFSDAGGFLVAELARMAGNPESRPAVARVMAADPEVRLNLLEQLARTAEDPETVLALAAATGRDDPAQGTPRWQRRLLDTLVARGDAPTAMRIWRRLVGIGEGAPVGLYDGDFAGLPGPPPFNWDLATGADGYAERAADGLEVEYQARNPARLASQLIVLPPGRYELAFEAEGQAEGDAGRLAWTIACHPGERAIASVPIAGVGYTPRRIAGAFSVPATGCSAQWLRLEGMSAEFPKPQQATIRRLRIARSGG